MKTLKTMKRSFASDNNAGVHPKILDAIIKANNGDCIAYGEDPYTKEAEKKFKEVFGENAEAFFTPTGTGTNVIGLSAMLKPYEAVVSAETAHIYADECGALERVAGNKILPLKTTDGKLTPEMVAPLLKEGHGEHAVIPKVISITQPTELGTVYTVSEVKTLAEFAKKNNMLVHMDGARIANAAAHLGVPLRAFTSDAGVDVLSFGGTKNGMMEGEAVVFFDNTLSKNFKFIRKQSGQLISKMRFVSAQFLAYFENDLWLRNAKHANEMAQLLASEAKKIKGIEIVYPVEANAVFVKLPKEKIKALQEKSFFYMWSEDSGIARWMTHFATTEEDVFEFISNVRKVLEG